MSRAFRENNAYQAVREAVTNGIAVPIAAGMAVYAHKTTKNNLSRGPFFLIPLAIMLQVFGHETVWMLRYINWVLLHRWNKQHTKRKAREARRSDYIWYAVINITIFLFACVPLAINLIAESQGQYQLGSIHAIIDPFAYGGVVAFVTGDILGTGLIAALERWGTLNGDDFSSASNVVLLVAAVLATSLAVLHALRVVLALAGVDKSYRRFMIAQRFGWDADSEALAAQGIEDPITASTNHFRPFFANFRCPNCNCRLDSVE